MCVYYKRKDDSFGPSLSLHFQFSTILMKLPIILFGLVFIILFCTVTAQVQYQNTSSALYNTNVNLTTVYISDLQGRHRNVSYYTVGKLAIVDGDIVYGIEALLLSRRVTATILERHALHKRVHSIFHDSPKKWPGAKVVYYYQSLSVKRKVQAYVDEAKMRWKKKNPFLQFEERPVCDEPVAGQLMITSIDCAGCYANLGWSSSSELYMNLQQPSGLCGRGCYSNEATHEFGHALGLYHEHQRPDRDRHQIFHCPNLMDPKCCNPGTCCDFSCFFRIIPNLDHSGPYGMTSLMQYRANAFARPGLITLESIPFSEEVVPNTNPGFPDLLDNMRICEIYLKECKLSPP
ncbi:6361_t:CDS:1 [Ambispora gerdemannii]|uniref:6361_t:CDS:1 n=1 Tax=Ambispora gerdemannii TaxID=144530 RepID=A0A9N9B439_9GLOM|nr:6361_t:CDS:1 [Ambispora gerdemannii]